MEGFPCVGSTLDLLEHLLSSARFSIIVGGVTGLSSFMLVKVCTGVFRIYVGMLLLTEDCIFEVLNMVVETSLLESSELPGNIQHWLELYV